jgi:SSS family solute:Na+ symporter
MLTTLDLVIIVLYFIGMVILGFFCRDLIKDNLDYSLAGRKLTFPVATATLAAGGLGAFAAIGQGGYAYQYGYAAFWLIISWCFGWAILAMLSKRLRRTEALSLPGVLEIRYGPKTAQIASIVTLIYCVNTLAAQMVAVGSIFAIIGSPWGIDLQIGTLIGAIVILAYTYVGGLYAVAYTDFAQMIILFLGLAILLPIYTISGVGGISALHQAMDPKLFDFWGGLPTMVIVGWFLSFLMTGVTNPPYIQRILASETEDVACKSNWVAIVLYAIVCVLIMYAAFAGSILFPGIEYPDQFVPLAISMVFPSGLVGLVTAALLALIMSTSDSYLLICATTTINDIYKVIRKDATDQELLKASKFFTVFWTCAALALAFWLPSAFKLFAQGSAAYGAGMFFPFIAALYWKRATGEGAIAGMLGGSILSISWNTFLGKPFGLDGVIVGSILCGLLLYFVSTATYKRDSELRIEV